MTDSTGRAFSIFRHHTSMHRFFIGWGWGGAWNSRYLAKFPGAVDTGSSLKHNLSRKTIGSTNTPGTLSYLLTERFSCVHVFPIWGKDKSKLMEISNDGFIPIASDWFETVIWEFWPMRYEEKCATAFWRKNFSRFRRRHTRSILCFSVLLFLDIMTGITAVSWNHPADEVSTERRLESR